MTEEQSDMRSEIQNVLNKFPEVSWDRWAGEFDLCIIFGWIKRDDGRNDFILLKFTDGSPDMIATSSSKYSKEFSARLNFEGHENCKRVERTWPETQCIKL
ncbi:MAG: hypothetical protein KGJ13_09100 [Patescibacteria group bacterium]|nr:hypothetical protein [Patescibacteria group bacterium]